MSDKKDAKKEARRLLARARRTAKLKNLANLRKDEDGTLFHKNGVRYEDINDDIADMRGELESAGLSLEDIGTNEDELERLKAASERLNAPYRAELARKYENRRRWIEDNDLD